MPKVTCPTCGCWALVLSPGDTVHLFAGDPPERCSRLQDRLRAGEAVKDLLACEEMAMAVETMIVRPGDPVSQAAVDPGSDDPLASWREDDHSRRRFLRQTMSLSASISAAGMRRKCAVDDVSPLGALISMQDCEGLETGTYVAFTPEGYRAIPAEVRHVDEGEDKAGLMLLHGQVDQVALAQWVASLEPASKSGISGLP